MSVPVRPVESFSGSDLNTISGSTPRLTFWLVRGLDELPEVRGLDTVIPGAAGRVARNRIRDIRTIEIQGHIAGVGSTAAAQTDDFRDAMETLRALFDPTAAAATLVVGLEDGTRSASINCRPVNSMTRYVSDVGAEMNVELEAIGSDWSIS